MQENLTKETSAPFQKMLTQETFTMEDGKKGTVENLQFNTTSNFRSPPQKLFIDLHYNYW